MSADLTLIKKLVASVLNATPNGYGDFSTDADPLHPEQEVIDAVSSAAKQVVAAIVDTPGHRRRSDFLELQVVTDGSLIMDSIGGVLIDSKIGTRISASKLRRYKANINTLLTIAAAGYYSLDGHIFNFIGTAAQIETIKDLDTADLLAPEEYTQAIVHGALAIIFTKEGSNVEAASHHGSLFQSMLMMIKGGATEIPASTQSGMAA